MNLYYIQTYISLIVCSSVLILNTIIYDWASRESTGITLNILLSYMVVDTIIGFKHYIKRDYATLIHHIIFTSFIICSKYLIYKHSYNEPLYKIGRWVLLNEASTFMNNIRILFSRTKYSDICNAVFAIVFLITRSIAVIGSYIELIDNDYFIYAAPLVVLIATLNIYWMTLIIRKASKKIDTIEKWNKYTRLTVFIQILIPIDLYNHGYKYHSIFTSMYVFTSILYHYGVKIRILDIFMLIMSIIYIFTNVSNIESFIFLVICCMVGFLVYILGYKYAICHCLTHIIFVLSVIMVNYQESTTQIN